MLMLHIDIVPRRRWLRITTFASHYVGFASILVRHSSDHFFLWLHNQLVGNLPVLGLAPDG
jgi:hypothetical protein